MRKHRNYMNIFMVIIIVINGVWVEKYTTLMFLCSDVILINSIGSLIYDKENK